jgi:hypothetical protein
MKVYRVEHPRTKRGAYSHGIQPKSSKAERKFADAISIAHERLPSGEEDFGCKMYGSLYGFKTKEQLKEWFRGWLPKLHKQGFQIVVYETRCWQLGRSKRQLCFLEYGSKVIKVETMMEMKK